MDKSAKSTIAVVVAIGIACVSVSAQARELIQNKGSDTLVNVAQA